MIYYCIDDACGYSDNTSKPLDFAYCYDCEQAGRNPNNVESMAEIECEIAANDSFEEWRD